MRLRGLGLSLLPFPGRYEVVLLLVVISGLGIAAYHPEGFKTAHFFTGDKMATGLAVFTVGGNIGLAIGPLVPALIITHLGFDYLPLMLLFAAAFLILLVVNRRALAHARSASVSGGTAQPSPSRAAYVSVGLIVAAVVMRSWTHFGLMAYIPFYYIDYEKGDPLYAGALVSVFLLGGAVGTLVGSPMADRWGYKRYLIMSLALTTVLFPTILVMHGAMLFVSLAVVGMAMISSFTVTIAMAQQLLPHSLGVASGPLAGFAIGTGGIGVTLLGVIADHFGVPAALKSIMLLPVTGLLISFFIQYPLRRAKPAPAKYGGCQK